MKAIIFLLSLNLLVFDAIAQKQPFKNFRVIENHFNTWIIPLDFEQAFEPLKQEMLEKDLNLNTACDTLLLTDGLDKWLNHTNLYIPLNELLVLDFYKEYEPLVPESLIKRMKNYWKRRYKTPADYYPHFSISAVVSSDGQIQSVFFNVFGKKGLTLVKEEELQAISRSVKQQPIDVSCFRFGYYTRQQEQEINDLLFGDAGKKLEAEERDQRLHDLYAQFIPSTRAFVKIYDNRYTLSKPTPPDYTTNPAYEPVIGDNAAATSPTVADFSRPFNYIAFLDSLEKYQQQIQTEKITNYVSYLNPVTFNHEDYLALFPALRVRPSCQVGCCYYYRRYPVWYAWNGDPGFLREKVRRNNPRPELSFLKYKIRNMRQASKKDTNSFVSKTEYRKFMKQFYHRERNNILAYRTKAYRRDNYRDHWALEDSTHRAIAHLLPEDNEMGYFQFLVFNLFGEKVIPRGNQFIRRKEQIERLIERNRKRDLVIDFDEQKMLPFLEMDLSPQVIMDAEKCTITFYHFQSSGGLSRETYSIRREAPFRAVLEEKVNLVGNRHRVIF